MKGDAKNKDYEVEEEEVEEAKVSVIANRKNQEMLQWKEELVIGLVLWF